MGKFVAKNGSATPAKKPAEKLPSDAELAKERADEQRRQALAVARENKKKKAEEAKNDEPELPRKPSLLYVNGCKQLSKLLWLISRPVAYLAGYSLTPLKGDELDELARELVPLTARLKWLVLVLGFVAFPLLFVELLERHAVARPKKPKPPAPAPSPATSTPPANVVQFEKPASRPAVTALDPADELAGAVESTEERVQ